MADEPIWKGQADLLRYSLEQIEVIASPSKSEVFFTFDWREPLSATDVAKILQKSSQTMRHHIADLVKVGLLLPVGTRKRRSRMEEVYVTAAIRCLVQLPPHTDDYIEYMSKGFDALLRQMGRERMSGLVLVNEIPETSTFMAFSLATSRMSTDTAQWVRERFLEIIERVRTTEDAHGVNCKVCVYLSPTEAELLKMSENRSNQSARPKRTSRNSPK